MQFRNAETVLEKQEDVLLEGSLPGMPASQQTKRDLTFKIPMHLPNETHLPSSYVGKLAQITYYLDLSVTYEGWLSSDKEKLCTLPVHVKCLPRLCKSRENFKVPANWQPFYVEQITYLF